MKKEYVITPDTIGEKLKELRTDIGISQAALSEKAGISIRSLSRLESGGEYHAMLIDTLCDIARAANKKVVIK